jgi:WD40 repeat protein
MAFLTEDRLLSSSDDLSVRLWDLKSRRCLAAWPASTGIVHALAATPDGGWFAAGGRNGLITLWPREVGLPAAFFHGHTSAIVQLVFSPDGNQLLSTSKDGAVRLWDTTGRQDGRTRSRAEGDGRSPASQRCNTELIMPHSATGIR